jgi:hypothetical protein
LATITPRLAALGAMLVLALTMSAPAMAQSGPQLQGYTDEAGQTQDVVNQTIGGGGGSGIAGETTPVDSVSASSGDSSLPFTGFDLGLMAAAAAALFGLGLGLRRLARPPQAL